KFNALDFDPDDLDLATIDQAAKGQTGAVESSATSSPAKPTGKKSSKSPATTPVVRRTPETETNVGRRDAATRLGQQLPALQFKAMPLGNFLRLISQLSGVPVSVAPEQLLMSGITAGKRVSLDAVDISLEEALASVLQPLKLEHVVREDQVILLHREASKMREIKYPIADLVNATTSAKLLADWTRQLVAPETWQTVGGSGTLEISPETLRVTQSQYVHYQLLIFLERLRLARSLTPKSRYPVKHLVGTSPWLALHDRLEAPTTFTFSQYTPLDEIFAHWQQELGVPLLVDWPALADQQLWPQTRIACAIADEPWRQALDQVLTPLGLDWRAAPGRSIEITTAEKNKSELQLDLFLLRGDVDAIRQKLPAVTKPQALVFDPTGKTLITLLPASAQRLIVQDIFSLAKIENAKLD
ncbi:MAG: STN domain-containing protein, partial [Pirellulales bacterium]|nr:STN domain-containing protein [Pirellulales bacterium]